MATTDTQLQQLVINVGTEDQITAGIASGTITEDMLSIATDGADITYDWIGTLAEYNTQNIATLHPDWLCFITDDVNNSGEDVYENVYSKTEANETFVAKNEAPAYLPCLLEFKWSDHILNNVSWLRADTFSWQSGEIYEGVYDHLVADIEGKTLQSETIEDITISYYLADDKHKICPASEESKLASLYDTTGVAWYYIIDTTNQRFKLPRTKYGVTGLRDTVGNYVPETLPNIWYSNSGYTSDPVIDGALTQIQRYNIFQSESSSSTRFIANYSFSATNCSDTYQDNAPVQQRATQMYLYFYVGEFSQDAIVNTAGITTEVLNNKADVTSILPMVVPDYANAVTIQATTTEQSYTCPSYGFVVVDLTGFNYGYCYLKINGVTIFNKTTNGNSSLIGATGQYMVSAGDVCLFKDGYANAEGFAGTCKFMFIPCKGV